MPGFLSSTAAKLTIAGLLSAAVVAAVVTFGPQLTPEAPAPPTNPLSSPTTVPPSTECEDFIFVPCLRQAATISIPLAGSTFSLTYSSDRNPVPTAKAPSGTQLFGLGGWGLNVLHAYDVKERLLTFGNGAKRRVDASPVQLDGVQVLAVPSSEATEIYVFDGQGRHLQTLDGITGFALLKFQWSDAGLLSISETGDHTTRILRNYKGVPTSIISTRGYRTRLGVKDGWLAAVATPSEHISRITTSPQGLITEFQNATNARTSFRYDSQGKLTAIEGPTGSSLTLKGSDSANGSSTTVTTGGGRSWTHSVKSDGTRVVRTYTDAAGIHTTVEIEGNKRVLKAPDGTIYRFTLQADPQWGAAAWIPAVEAETPAGRRWTITETRKGGPSNPHLQPQTHQRTLTVDGAAWTLSYEPSSRTIAFHTPEGGSRTTTLNDKGQPLRIDQTGSAPLVYAYDSQSRLKSITHGEGADARQWRYEYNPTERTVTTTDPLGKRRVVSFDRSGHATAMITPGGNKVAAERNELEQVTAFSPPGRSATRWNYRQDGLVDMMTLPAGADGLGLTTYGYDKDGLVTEVKQADGNGITVKRDGAGRIKQIETHPGSWRTEYDPKTGLATQLEGAGETVTFAYDGPQAISETWSGVVSAQITRGFDGQGRVVAENIGDASKVEYGYDTAGRLIQAGELAITRNPSTGQIQSERLGILERTWQYNKFGEVVGTAITASGKPVYKLTVGRDKLGRVIERVEQLANGKTHKRVFSYDKEDRLASFRDGHGPITKYTYDANGNLVRESSADKTIEATYDGQDKLIRRGTDHYKYDSAGRLATSTTKSGKTSYEYDRGGHLLSVILPSGKKVSYAIDGEGRHTGRSIDGKLMNSYVYGDLLRPVAKLGGDGKLISRFVYALPWSAPTYFMHEGKAYLIVTDEQGTPRLVLDTTSGALAEEMKTDAWGRLIAGSAARSLPFGFAGGLADPDTGFVHFGVRDYDPVSARWTSQDPIGFEGGDANLYRYTGGDPVNRRDPDGMAPCDVVGFGFGVGGGLPNLRGGSVEVGIVTGDTDLGVYSSTGVGFSTPGVSSGFQIHCLDKVGTQPKPALERFGGAGEVLHFGVGPVGGGWNTSYNDDKSPSLVGSHWSLGPDLGGNAQFTETHVGCLSCLRAPFKKWYEDAKRAIEKYGESQSPFPLGATFPVGKQKESEKEENLCNKRVMCDTDNEKVGPLVSKLVSPLLERLFSLGDPHLLTADGLSFDFMAVGEFTALRSDSGDMVVQVRQIPWKDSRWVSVTPAVALNVNGDRIMIEHSHESLLLRINRKPTVLKDRVDLPKGGFLVPEGRSYLIGWPDGSVLRVLRNVRGLDLSMGLAEGRKGTVSGLLGPFTGTQADAIVTKAGTSIKSDEINYKRLYREYGDSWRITQAESLFDYDPGKSTKTYDDRTFPDPNPPKIPAATENSARAICERAGVPKEAMAGCILDVAVTGEAGFAVTTAEALRPMSVVTPRIEKETASNSDDTTQTFELKLGDHVAVDKPSKGAGRIEKVGAVDRYTFTAQAGTVVYLKADPNCKNPKLRWGLQDPTGTFFLYLADQYEMCVDPGRAFLTTTGTYTVVVKGDKDATGDYGFTVLPIAADQTFPLKLGEPVAPDKPALGAGRIETPGARDAYTFTAAAGSLVYLKADPNCKNPKLRWGLQDPTGTFFLYLADQYEMCVDPGRALLTTTGIYTVVVKGDKDAMGDYGFTVLPIAADQTFPLKLGEPVAPDKPALGAGRIETPGARDAYTFTAAAGSLVYLKADPNCKNPKLRWGLQDPTGTFFLYLADQYEMCADPGRALLTTTGTYTVVVKGDKDATGDYGFTVLPIAADQTFPLKLGESVAPDKPAKGAGRIETVGARDLYTFTAAAGSQVYLKADPNCKNSKLRWGLQDSAGKFFLRFPEYDICEDQGRALLETAGTYTIVVKGYGDVTGDYAFTLLRGNADR